MLERAKEFGNDGVLDKIKLKFCANILFLFCIKSSIITIAKSFLFILFSLEELLSSKGKNLYSFRRHL